MPNGITPLIKKISNFGTLVTFQSTDNDISYCFNSSNKATTFSKFALLRIPDIITPVNGSNNITFDSIEGAYVSGLSTAEPFPENERFNLAESLQNYMLNLETMIIRGDNYDPTKDLKVSERVFWKWMKEIGAIRYRESTPSEMSPSTSSRYVEEDDNSDISSGLLYNRVVQYIGEIDMEGNSRSNANAFKEVYIYVPTNSGGSPYVQFKSVSDVNYFPSMVIKQTDTVNITLIQGQNTDVILTSTGLRTLAFYDQQVSDGISYDNDVWFLPLASNGPYAYYTDIDFNDTTVDSNAKDSGYTYYRSRLDGICIDFEKSDYTPIYNDNTIKSFADWNSRPFAKSRFEFNAILIYYDIYDLATPNIKTTNLYGILFIDNLVSVGGSGANIETFLKIKPDGLLNQNGNGYSLKLNLRFDSSANEVTVEVSVNDYNTFSMLLYIEAMSNVANLLSQTERVLGNNALLSKQVQDLENILLNGNNAASLSTRIDELSLRLTNSITNGIGSGITDLINKLNNKINDIIANKYVISLASVLNVVSSDGIFASKTDNTVLIGDKKQKYNGVIGFTMYMGSDQTNRQNMLVLKPKSNIYYHINNGITLTAHSDINLYIDDSLTKWENNQSMIVYLSDSIDFGSSSGITIYTDALNIIGNGEYGITAGIIPHPTPNSYIEIICIDKIGYNFLIVVR